MKRTAGIVLAGGLSSRMGRNKALLEFRPGVPLVEHMQQILRSAGITDIYISGAVPGYKTLPDAELHKGPARAIARLLKHFNGAYKQLLFIPVDMPFMGPDILQALIGSEGDAFIEGHPLPCSLLTRDDEIIAESVKGLLNQVSASGLREKSGQEKAFLNLNTPEEWDAAVRVNG